MTISSHYSGINAQKGLISYYSLLLGIYELARLRKESNEDYLVKLSLVKRSIHKLKDVHITDSIKNLHKYSLDFGFIEELVNEIEKGLVDFSGLDKKILPILDNIPKIKFS